MFLPSLLPYRLSHNIFSLSVVSIFLELEVEIPGSIRPLSRTQVYSHTHLT